MVRYMFPHQIFITWNKGCLQNMTFRFVLVQVKAVCWLIRYIIITLILLRVRLQKGPQSEHHIFSVHPV